MELPIYFNYTEYDIKNISNKIIEKHNKWLSKIMKNTQSNDSLNPSQFLDSYLYYLSEFNYIERVINFLKYVSPDHRVREASSKFHLKLIKFYSDFFRSEDNYKLFLILKKIKIPNPDTNNLKKLIKNILKGFEDNGVNLSQKKRETFTKISNKLVNLENNFSQNIANDVKHIKYSENDLKGIDKNILNIHKKGNSYLFDTSYPDENLVLTQCEVEESRKRMYYSFNSVAKKNLSILKDVINLRTERAKILGFKNSVDFYLSYNRLATQNNIQRLLNKLIPLLKNKVESDKEYKRLLDLSGKKELYDYDLRYYSNLYKKQFLHLDQQIIKHYFPSDYSIIKIITIYSELFNIKSTLIKESKSKYWHSDVNLYEVKDLTSKAILGYFYLDLYPRDGKYTHAATFDLQTTYRDINNNRIIPVTAVVCNYSPPELPHKYSLLTFGEIVTFCHEFGHALHNILSDVKYESLAGISMEEDFGEMPSQFFENWCYNKDFLKKISLNHSSGKKIPLSIINKIRKNKNFQNGMQYLTQILYIKYDLTIHKKEKVTEEYLRSTWFSIAKELLPFKISEDTYPMCRFDHIISYASGYYGYLWSLIYSYDAFSLFETGGVFNKELGLRFRKEILEKGGTIKGTKMLENFLNREHSNNYFFKII